MVGNLMHRKTDNTIIKNTNNGWQHHTQKNRQYNYKKRQTLVGNLIHRKTDNTIIKKRQTMVGNIIYRKTDNTIIKKDKQ